MKHPRVVIGIVSLIILGILVSLGAEYGHSFYVHYNLMKEDRSDLYRLRTMMENRKKILLNMEQTMKERYGFLTSYEVHYYSVIIRDFSEQYEIPWTALAALIRIESNFDPSLKSPAGAKGLTQVMEYTGEKIADSLGIRYKEGTTLWNDLLNAIIGFTYFCEEYKKKRDTEASTDESIRHAIGTYIGGHNYAQKKKNDHRVYVKEYQITLYQEYKTLSWMYRGVTAENNATPVDLTKPEIRLGF